MPQAMPVVKAVPSVPPTAPAGNWARLSISPDKAMIGMAQQLAHWFSTRFNFADKQRQSIELVVEELLSLVLHYSFDDGRTRDGELSIEFRIEAPRFRITVIDLGLPFDLSMVPGYRPERLGDEDETIAGLSVHLLKHKTDHFRVVNLGREGLRLEAAWFLPGAHLEELGYGPPSTSDPGGDEPREELALQRLDAGFALQIARLVFRGYSYSYVYADIYYPERTTAFMQSGVLFSWGAVTASGELVGHLALMKESADSRVLEWGVAVVAPDWRGRGIMERLLQRAIDYATGRDEAILLAHAVTAHIYTQKTAARFGFHPTALLLGYAPSSLRFKGLEGQPAQRESTFLVLHCLRPMPTEMLYLPPRYAGMLRILLAQLDPPLPEEYLCEGNMQAEWQRAVTEYEVSSAQCINVGRIFVSAAGADCISLIGNETRRLARGGVDVIYLTVDLADPGTSRLVEIAREVGYSIAGLCPMMPFNYGLCLQYLCSCEVNLASVQAEGPLGQWLKEQVQQDYRPVAG